MSAVDRVMSALTFDRGTYLGLAKGKLPNKGEALDDVVNGDFVVKIDKIVYKPNSPKIGEMIAVEMTVTTSNAPEKHPAGAKRSWVQKLSTAVGVSSYKSFLYAALGAETVEQKAKADVALPTILAAIEANQPHVLIGREVECTVSPYKIQNGATAGTWITLNSYRAVK